MVGDHPAGPGYSDDPKESALDPVEDWICTCTCPECGDGIEECCCPESKMMEHECTCNGDGS